MQRIEVNLLTGERVEVEVTPEEIAAARKSAEIEAANQAQAKSANAPDAPITAAQLKAALEAAGLKPSAVDSAIATLKGGA